MSLYTLIIVAFVIFMAINVIIGLRGRKHASTGSWDCSRRNKFKRDR